MENEKLKRGDVVYMKSDSGLIGYGNPQCVSWVSHEIGELSLYGHNEHYHTYDVKEIIPTQPAERTFTQQDLLDAFEAGEQRGLSYIPYHGYNNDEGNAEQYFKDKFGIYI